MKEQCSSYGKYKAIRTPTCNCKACWDLWFFKHAGEYTVAKSGVEHFGKERVIAVRGEVYVKQLLRFAREHDSGPNASSV
jgi:hypothetical protein